MSIYFSDIENKIEIGKEQKGRKYIKMLTVVIT